MVDPLLCPNHDNDASPAFKLGDIVTYTRRHFPHGAARKPIPHGEFRVIAREPLEGRRRRDGSDYPNYHIARTDLDPKQPAWHTYASADELRPA